MGKQIENERKKTTHDARMTEGEANAREKNHRGGRKEEKTRNSKQPTNPSKVGA
jgi:hypothetical protein